MIRAHYFNSSGEILSALKPEQIPSALADEKGLLWVDFVGEDPEVCEKIFLEIFNFHPLAIDDALRESHVPKVDNWDHYLYIVLHDIGFLKGEPDIETYELDVFLGSNFIVTHHDMPIRSLDHIWDTCERDERNFKRGADHILYRIADELTADFMKVIDDLDEEIEWVEDQVFSKPRPVMVQRIFALKRVTLHLRRVMSPLREVLNKLARDDYNVIDARDQVYFRDVYDHLVRLHDISESLRDLVGGALDTYLSVINNRMNEVMKTLTLITTLFMPISFLVGFFGMNFFQPISNLLISWTDTLTFSLTFAIIILTPATMYLWLRRRGWM